MNEVLMNENFKFGEKMTEMEKSLRYYEEEDSRGREVSGSMPEVCCSVFAGLYSIVTEPCLLLSTSGHLMDFMYCLAAHTGLQCHTMTVLTEHTHSAGGSLK